MIDDHSSDYHQYFRSKCVEYYNTCKNLSGTSEGIFLWDGWRRGWETGVKVDELVGGRGRGSHSAHATGAGVVYTPIEAIKFSSFRLRVSKWRAPLPVAWWGSCRCGTFRRPWGLAVSMRPEGLSLLPGLPALSVGLRLRFSGSTKLPKLRGQRQSSSKWQKKKICGGLNWERIKSIRQRRKNSDEV